MKKYFPILTFLMVFFVFLGAQVSFDLVRFEKSKSKGIEYQAYQDIFSKISFRTIDNKKIILSKVRSPLIVLNFWASWCAPCLKELQSLVILKKRFREKDLLVIGINADEENQLEKKLKIQDEFDINFPIVADSLGRDLGEVGVYGRKGLTERTAKEIGIHTMRAGDIIGEHRVLFGGMGENFEIFHRAQSRQTFARGSIRAAQWILNQPKGMYDMQHVLGLA